MSIRDQKVNTKVTTSYAGTVNESSDYCILGGMSE